MTRPLHIRLLFAACLLVLAGLYANRFARARQGLTVRATPAAAMIAAVLL